MFWNAHYRLQRPTACDMVRLLGEALFTFGKVGSLNTTVLYHHEVYQRRAAITLLFYQVGKGLRMISE